MMMNWHSMMDRLNLHLITQYIQQLFKSVVNISVFSLRTRIPPAILVGKLTWAYIVAGQLLVEHFQYTLSPRLFLT
jgi:hypothetical protein